MSLERYEVQKQMNPCDIHSSYLYRYSALFLIPTHGNFENMWTGNVHLKYCDVVRYF